MSDGTFVWHELRTTAAEEAQRFFTALFGWTAVHHAGPEGTYTIFHQGDRRVGGLMGIEPNGSVSSHWLPFVSVPRLEDAIERAVGLGAKMELGPVKLTSIGRFAKLEDPQGGYIAPCETGPGFPAPLDEELPPAGLFCWDELNSTDPDGSVRFYASLFGWKTESTPMESGGDYTLLYADRKQQGGITQGDGPPLTRWLSYLHVTDVDASARRAENLGGRVLVPPGDIPGMGRFAVLADPSGAVFAIFRSARE